MKRESIYSDDDYIQQSFHCPKCNSPMQVLKKGDTMNRIELCSNVSCETVDATQLKTWQLFKTHD